LETVLTMANGGIGGGYLHRFFRFRAGTALFRQTPKPDSRSYGAMALFNVGLCAMYFASPAGVFPSIVVALVGLYGLRQLFLAIRLSLLNSVDATEIDRYELYKEILALEQLPQRKTYNNAELLKDAETDQSDIDQILHLAPYASVFYSGLLMALVGGGVWLYGGLNHLLYQEIAGSALTSLGFVVAACAAITAEAADKSH
jgi:hypothetical protein